MKSLSSNLNRNLKQALVLLVDDNDEQVELMQATMQQYLPEVGLIRRTTPQEALTWLQDTFRQDFTIPKLILLDLYLPTRQEGFALLEQINELGLPFASIPIVMLSYSNAQADISQAYEQGASSFLTKPLDYPGWLSFFQQLRTYWWETVTLPSGDRNLL
jgi:CheY-like chemotaxis protein